MKQWVPKVYPAKKKFFLYFLGQISQGLGMLGSSSLFCLTDLSHGNHVEEKIKKIKNFFLSN
jgi:hypothetical protein